MNKKLNLVLIKEYLANQSISYDYFGKEDISITSVRSIDEYSNSSISFFTKDEFSKYQKERLNVYIEGLIFVSNSFNINGLKQNFIKVKNPKIVFMQLVNTFFTGLQNPKIDKFSKIHPNAQIGKNVSIGAFSVIGDAIVGDNCEIGSGVIIASGSKIGNFCKIFDGAKIGTSGLGSEINIENKQVLFPHLGSVIIEDNVVIGSATVINKGTLSNTIIGKGSHISGCCFIGHGCKLGKRTYLAACAKLAGSVIVGDFSYIGFSSSVKESVVIPEGCTIGIGVVLNESINEPNTTAILKKNFLKTNTKLFSLKRTYENK